MAGGGATWGGSLQRTQRRLEALDARRASAIVLVIACLISTVLILVVTRGTTFTTDEWHYLLVYRGWSPTTLLHPDNGHLIVLPLVLFKVVVAASGANAYLPTRLYSIALTLTTAVLVYVIARRRLGPVLALAPAVLLLFFGAGWETELSPASVPNELSFAAGLGALIALERRARNADLGSCVLLTVSLASHTVGLAFVVGAAVELALRGRGWLTRRWWVFGVPLVLYIAWFAWARTLHVMGPHQTPISASGVGSVLAGGADELAAVCAAITGLFRTPGASQLATQLAVRIDWGFPLAAALVALAVIRFRRPPRPTPRVYTMIAIMTTFLALIAVGFGHGRVPTASRYAWWGAVLALVLVAELAAGVRLGRGAVIATFGVLGLSLIGNVAQLHTAGSFFRQLSDYDRAQLGALELVRGRVPPTFAIQQPTNSLLPHYDFDAPAAAYFATASEFGSPALKPDQLAKAPEGPREAADQLMARALSLVDVPSPQAAPPGSGGRRVAVESGQGRLEPRSGCVRITPTTGRTAVADLLLPTGGFTYSAPPATRVSLAARRFASMFSVALPAPLGSGRVLIPTDRSAAPWHAQLSIAAPVDVCPAPA